MPQTRIKSFLSLLALCTAMPFNMGGCADTTAALGGMVGGDKGAQIGRGVGDLGNSSMLAEKDEKAMGESVAMQVTAKFQIDANTRLNQYVALVGLTLANSSPRPDGNWYFAVVDDAQANAFSGPDGYIFVTTAAIKEMRDESELAGVLAHEMTHVMQHDGLHAAKRAGQTAAAGHIAGAMTQGNQMANQFAAGVTGAGDMVLVKGYDHHQEDDADAGAVKLMSTTGYDPAGYLRFLTRVSAEQQQGGKNAAFSTHPDAASRVTKVTAAIAKLPRGGATLADRYAKMTAGIR